MKNIPKTSHSFCQQPPADLAEKPISKTSQDKNKSLSMHENIPVWYDCCSCEAEPYWLEAMASEADKNNN